MEETPMTDAPAAEGTEMPKPEGEATEETTEETPAA